MENKYIEELNKRIDKSEASISRGRVVSHTEVMKKIEDFIKEHNSGIINNGKHGKHGSC